MGGGYKAAMVFCIILFGVGLVCLLVSPFVDTNQVSSDSVLSPLINLLVNGFVLDLPLLSPFDVNLFFFLPSEVQKWLDTQFVAFSYLPNYLSIPLCIILLFSLIYAVISFIPTVPGG